MFCVENGNFRHTLRPCRPRRLDAAPPDASSFPLRAVRRFLRSPLGGHVRACFWDFASLPQHASDVKRSEADDEIFGKALYGINEVYASPVGTTVLQLKEIPPRPTEFDGALALFNLADGVDEAKLRAARRCGARSAAAGRPKLRMGIHSP